MKIAHVNFVPYGNMIGVEKKLTHQAKAAFEQGLSIDFFVLNSQINKSQNNLNFIKLKTSSINLLAKIQLKLFRFSTIEKSFDFDKYDYIVLRYINMDFSAMRFIRKYGNKIITEHHTDEIGELKSGKKTFVSAIRLLLEEKISPKFMSKVFGIIGVTEEIRKVELKKIKNKKPSIVISNGINVEDVEFTKYRVLDNELNIIFVASYFATWHGLDRVLEGLKKYTGKNTINMYLVGDLSDDDKITAEEIDDLFDNINIKITGKIFGDELDEIFEKSSLAIASLALHRKNMKEACALKTREYMARGIPFVYGYDDSDLEGSEEFTLKIENNDSFIDMENIISFVKKVNSISDISDAERKFAKDNVDWTIKVLQMYNFVAELNKRVLVGNIYDKK